jgi:NTE family protein
MAVGYVDGGVRSSTSLDLVAKADLDEVYVLAPLASYVMDRSWNPATRIERMVRRVVTIGLGGEADKVRAAGTKVTLLTPGPEDLEAFGANLMNPALPAACARDITAHICRHAGPRRPVLTERSAA